MLKILKTSPNQANRKISLKKDKNYYKLLIKTTNYD